MIAKIIFAFVIAVLVFFSIDKILMIIKEPKKILNFNKSKESFVSGNCPTTMIKKGDKIMLYNPELAEVPGVNPLIMNSLKDYKEYVKWQRASGLECPILHLEKIYNAQGDEQYEIKRSFAGEDQDIYVGALNHNLPIIQKEPKIQFLLDAQSQNNAIYNKNQLPAYDPYNQNIGRITKMDVNGGTEICSS
tara:strand:+ start:466 stop:1038 length:573 start_codon:yes stop_codon:yes gene_type:complete